MMLASEPVQPITCVNDICRFLTLSNGSVPAPRKLTQVIELLLVGGWVNHRHHRTLRSQL
jgi:hypothetical protein